MKPRRVKGEPLEKVWGTADTEPWYPRAATKTGEVWFTDDAEPRLLLKFLFTSASLSVQVHPGDTPEEPGKTEMWHVLRAEPGARLALGFREPLTEQQAREAALSGEIEHLLAWHQARPGETYLVPAGTVHAIGAGLVLCEIQQHSDVTYRLYDYGRPRELHLDAGLAVAHLGGHPGASREVALGGGRTLLAECRYFRTESLAVEGEMRYRPGPQAEFLMWVEGKGTVEGEEAAAGDVWIVPTGTGEIRLAGRARVLRSFVP